MCGCQRYKQHELCAYSGRERVSSGCRGANGCREIKLQIGNESAEAYNAQTKSNWLYYEWEVFRDIHAGGDYNRCYELLEHSQSVMSALMRARKDAGIVFAADLR